MVTTYSSSGTSTPDQLEDRMLKAEIEATPEPVTPELAGAPGFFELLGKSIFEPGVNPALVMAMNISFFFLTVVLFALVVMTSWNLHVIALLLVSILLWGAMVWFVMEITRVQTNPENMPLPDPLLETGPAGAPEAGPSETRKDR